MDELPDASDTPAAILSVAVCPNRHGFPETVRMSLSSAALSKPIDSATYDRQSEQDAAAR